MFAMKKIGKVLNFDFKRIGIDIEDLSLSDIQLDLIYDISVSILINTDSSYNTIAQSSAYALSVKEGIEYKLGEGLSRLEIRDILYADAVDALKNICLCSALFKQMEEVLQDENIDLEVIEENSENLSKEVVDFISNYNLNYPIVLNGFVRNILNLVLGMDSCNALDLMKKGCKIYSKELSMFNEGMYHHENPENIVNIAYIAWDVDEKKIFGYEKYGNKIIDNISLTLDELLNHKWYIY